MSERQRHVEVFPSLVDELADQRLAAEKEDPDKNHRRGRRDIELGAEGIGYAPGVAAAVILGGEDTRPGEAAEDAEVENKEQLIDDGDAGHRLRPHLAHHDIVQEVYEVGNHVLDQNGNQDQIELAVKGPAADIFFKAQGRHPHRMVCDSIVYACEKSKPLDKRGDLYYIYIN